MRGPKGIIVCVMSSIFVLLAKPANVAYTQAPPVFETTIDAIAWHPDSTMIALGLEDGRCVVVDAQSQETEFSATVGTWSVRAVAWNNSGTRFAAGNGDGTLKTWAMPEQRLLHTWKETWKRGFGVATWTPQDAHIVSEVGDEITVLSTWDAETGELLVERHLPNISAIAWRPDGSKLAVANFIGYVLVVDGETFDTEAEFAVGTDTSWVSTVAWNPDGQWIAEGSVDGTIRVWDFHTQELVYLLDGNEGEVNTRTADTGLTTDSNILHIAFSPDGNHLGSVSVDGTVRIWDTLTGQVVLDANLVHGVERVSAAAWNSDGTQLAYGVRKSRYIRESQLEVIPLSLGQDE